MPEQRRRSGDLLRDAVLTSVPDPPAVFDSVEPKFVFVPTRHARALEPDTMLVTGVRGAGKSFWWAALQHEQLRDTVLGRKVAISVGFGPRPDPNWPDRDELQQLLASGCSPRVIWKAVVLRQIAPEAVSFVDWRQWVNWVAENASPVATLFRDFDMALSAKQGIHLVLFDALDRSADTRADQEKLLSGLLQLVLEFRGFRALRAKVFARPDMLEGTVVKSFPDASKVLASGVKLEWRTLDLYGLLFQYLGNASDELAAAEFRKLAGRHGAQSIVGQTWDVPTQLRDDAEKQRRAFEAIAGPYMGTDARRGKTYAWVPNHLADGLNSVSPRSFLAAIRRAADEPSKHSYALHWSGLQEGVRHASEVRVDEIQEDLPWAHEALKMLESLVVPCPRSKILGAWQRGNLMSKGLKGLPADREGVMEELRRVGIFKLLADGRVNIPDVYRLGFRLRRHGGFAPRR